MADRSLTVEIGNGEGSFIGVKIEPGIKYRLVMKSHVCLNNIAQDPTTHRGKSDEECDRKGELVAVTCNLGSKSDRRANEKHSDLIQQERSRWSFFWGNQKDLQHPVRFSVREGDEMTLYVKGKGTYYVCGYKTSVDYSID